MSGNVFWYYVGNRAEHLIVNGMPTLVSPHKYFLAPENQPIPAHAKNLFKRRNPPADIAAQFGVAPQIAEVNLKVVEEETAKALAEKAEAEKTKRAAAGDGKAREPLAFGESIREIGAFSNKPPESKPESRNERKERERKEREEKEKNREAGGHSD